MKTDVAGFTAERIAKLRENIDFSDIPELTEEDFARGYFKYRKPIKKDVTFRIDIDNLAWLPSKGAKDYAEKINAVLRWARQNGCPVTQM